MEQVTVFNNLQDLQRNKQEAQKCGLIILNIKNIITSNMYVKMYN